jgi:ectoine hydroxylase-related dioxygenase (phytanoyl-CoA dioxygenase family)
MSHAPILDADAIERFQRDGFLVIPNLIDMAEVEALRERFEPMFRGDFETGIYPDEWNWKEGRDPADVTRQICNGWKADRTIARRILHPEVGQIAAELAGWRGSRIGQDNVLWKPPRAKPLGFHQDDAYCQWVVPPHYITVWMALDDTSAEGGTLEYARGSHTWGVRPPGHAFHAPTDYRASLREAASAVGAEMPEIVPVEVPAGGCAIHDGRTWHGSGPNRTDATRRAVVSHCIAADAIFHETNINYIYSRYKRVGDVTMDESFFPVIWRDDGYRTPFLNAYCDGEPKSQ